MAKPKAMKKGKKLIAAKGAKKGKKVKRAKRGEGKIKPGLPTKDEILKRHKKFKKELGEKLIPRTKLKAYFKSIGIRAGGDLIMGFTDEVYALLKKAALRTVKNGRKTVRTWDF